jgi:hypothetical protein
MAITLTGTGGLMTRLGKLFFAIKSANLYLGGTDISAGGLRAVGVSADQIEAQYQSALQDIVDGLYGDRDAVRNSLQTWKQELASLAEQTLIQQAHADNPLTGLDVDSAMKEFLYQIKGAGTIVAADNDVDASTVSASVAAATGNTGVYSVVASVKMPDGRANELVFAETLDLICTGVGTARQESWSLRGEVAQLDPLAWDWPKGSGASASPIMVDADGANTLNTLLYGGNFDSFTTANQPDYFGAAIVGVYGTDIFSEATVVYRTGGKALKFTGTGGSPLSSIAQEFDVTTPAVGTSGTSATLLPNRTYHVNFFARKSAGLVAGEVQCRLIDGSNAQVTDDTGSDIKFSVAHGTLSSAAWTAVSGSFTTPKVLPTTAKLNIRVSVALTNTESVYIDDLSMALVPEAAYTGGINVTVHAGSTDPILGDRSLITVANNRAGEFQEWFDRVFSMKAKGLQVYSDTAGGETLADSLIS